MDGKNPHPQNEVRQPMIGETENRRAEQRT